MPLMLRLKRSIQRTGELYNGSHQETIELAVKTAILRAHPIGSYYLTEGDENPADFIGGVEPVEIIGDSGIG